MEAEAGERRAESMDRAEAIFHPVRMRIIQALVGREGMTIHELDEALDDVPLTSLYRHVNRLVDAGILRVVETRPVRGAMERRYAYAEGSSDLSQEDLRFADRPGHMRYFATFAAGLLGAFGRYLHHSDLDLSADRVAYRNAFFYASEEEVAEFAAALRDLIRRFESIPPAPNRRRRLFAYTSFPVEPRREKRSNSSKKSSTHGKKDGIIYETHSE